VKQAEEIIFYMLRSIKPNGEEYTIVACATSVGRSGVAIVRISGPLVMQIAQHILLLSPGITLQPRYATVSSFVDRNGVIIDQGLALLFVAPNSFTGENILELHCHGSPVVIDCLIKRVVELGVVVARPGEFSERAFLNGRIDLAQAEAIADLIDASSMQAAHYAVRSLQGAFSQRVHELIEQVTRLRVSVEAAIDFADEEIELISPEHLRQELAQIAQSLLATQQAAQRGVLIRDGVSAVIVGKPNVGKSSLLNCLSGEESAIVTPLAGTTRDVLKVDVRLDGVALQLLDTAGLRDHNERDVDVVEREGVRRAWAEIARAQCILLVVDFTLEGQKKPLQLWQEYFAGRLRNAESEQHAGDLRIPPPTRENFIVIYNKVDLSQQAPSAEVIDDINCVYISARHHHGIDLLRAVLQQRAGGNQTDEGGFSARRRHLLALEQAQKHLEQAQNVVMKAVQKRQLVATELVAEELREVQQTLGEVTGEVTTEDLLGRIFSEFCIGK
jgi:tRNA modification GTPase